jgi:arginyl-tRNA synthetase
MTVASVGEGCFPADFAIADCAGSTRSCSIGYLAAMESTIALLKTRLQHALATAFGADYAATDPVLVPASNPKFGDYQANVALSLTKQVGQPPRAIATALVAALDVADLCEPPEIAGPGFINLKFRPTFLAAQLQAIQADPRLGIAPVATPQRVIVDFSSPNIAKEMHVGHLRSTIIGDCLARILEFQGHDVLRLNHVGDWGTQFGMLITYLREVAPAALTTANAIDLGDLVAFYKQAKQRFDEDADFQERSRQEVVQLQSGAADTLRAWQLLCEQSRREFQVIYELLDIQLTERGESFYNPLLAAVVEDLAATGLLVEDDGAQCVFLEGFSNKEGKPLPLIVKKSDGGYNYATTDLAALRYRLAQDRATRLLYVTDAGQASHFAQVFQVARRAGWLPDTVEVVHVPFGLVQGEDGKRLKTRSGDTVRLRDLLDESAVRFRQVLEERLRTEERSESEEFIATVSQVAGLSAVKYADLSQNRTSNYIFSYDKMLADKGNTAPYMIYAYARVQSISRKGGIDFAQWERSPLDGTPLETPIQLLEESELVLAKHILQLDDAIAQVSQDLMPNRLCQYLFELSQKFNTFYDACPVLKAEEPIRTSRLMLSDLTARTLKLGLSLLGIPVLERM